MIEKHGMKLFYGFFIVLFIGMFIISNIDAKEPEESISIEAENAQTFEVMLDMPIGTLHLEEGAGEALMEAEFFYENNDVGLNVDYNETEDIGELHVRPRNPDLFTSPTDNEYEVQLSTALPIALTLNRERGDSTIYLKDVLLSHLRATLGNGKNDVRLEANYPILTEVELYGNRHTDVLYFDGNFPALERLQIDTNSGNDDVRLSGEYPELTSVSVDTAADDDVCLFSGSYENLATATLTLGTGDDRLVIDGEFPSLQKFTIHVSTGDDIIDLTKLQETDVEVEIISEAGSTRIYLPTTIGVAVAINGLEETTVSTRNMRQDGDLWVNTAYNNEDFVLRVVINTSSIETVELIAAPPSEPLLPPMSENETH